MTMSGLLFVTAISGGGYILRFTLIYQAAAVPNRSFPSTSSTLALLSTLTFLSKLRYLVLNILSYNIIYSLSKKPLSFLVHGIFLMSFQLVCVALFHRH